MKLGNNLTDSPFYSRAKYSKSEVGIEKTDDAVTLSSQISFTGGINTLADNAVNVTTDVLLRERDAIKDAFERRLADSGAPRRFGQIMGDFFSNFKQRAGQFIRENITEGSDITYDNYDLVRRGLRNNFGSTFAECRQHVEDYNCHVGASKHGPIRDFLVDKLSLQNGRKDRFIYLVDEDRDLVTFHKDPFVKNVCFNIKEFVVGNLLDAAIEARRFVRGLHAKIGRSEMVDARTTRFAKFNDILDTRMQEVQARDSYYRLMGVFEQVFDGVDAIKARQVVPQSGNLQDDILAKIGENMNAISKKSVAEALNKTGNYNTKTERAMNRLGTGLVSAIFASTDFYNISMLQNNDKHLAEKAQKKRFWQDMRRQGLTAGITYIVLGSLQKNVNKSVLAAALSLGGVTLISEVLSRVMGGISLVPLSPEKAREKALINELKKAEEDAEGKKTPPKYDFSKYGVRLPEKTEQPKKQEMGYEIDPKYEIYSDFINKVEYKPVKRKDEKKLSFRALNKNEKADNKGKKKHSVLSFIGKAIGGIIAASLITGFLRTHNVFRINDAFNFVSKNYNKLIERLTRKRLIMSKDDVDGLMNYLKKNHFNEQHDIIKGLLNDELTHGAMKGHAETVRRFVPRKEINPEGLYYDMGYVPSKAKKIIVDLVTYPISFTCKLSKKFNDIVQGLICGKPAEADAMKVSKKQALEFIEDYATKYRDSLIKGQVFEFDQELRRAFTKHFSEASSSTNNGTLAQVSRLLITFITGYFFVNDYRNQVLIESKGEDIERANATKNERIGHKLSNYILNSMFMDLFNSTFERWYLGSVAGATLVAMATEVTNETAVRLSICSPIRKMDRNSLIQYENERLKDDGLMGRYYRGFMRLTGKKPLSEKAKD